MKSLYQRKEDALLCLAYASLLNWKEKTDPDNVLAEKARIERIIEEYYKSSIPQEYNSYVLGWIKEHGRELVYGSSFAYDIQIPDEVQETNVENFFRKSVDKVNWLV